MYTLTRRMYTLNFGGKNVKRIYSILHAMQGENPSNV
jgi:hypothetical protein